MSSFPFSPSKIWLAALALGLLAPPGNAASISGAPAFVVSSLPGPLSTGAVLPVTPAVLVSGSHTEYDGDGNLVTVPVGSTSTIETGSPVEASGGYTDAHVTNSVTLRADPGNLDVRGRLSAEADPGYVSNASGSIGALNWYVVGGGSGPITLRADLLVQGIMFAGTENTQGGFRESLSVLESPSDVTRERVIDFQRRFLDPAGCGVTGTILQSGVCLDRGTDQITNYVIRSNPFTVTQGDPFLLIALNTLFISSTGTPTDRTITRADFFDPQLATTALQLGLPQLSAEGLVIDTGRVDDQGQPIFETLAQNGLTLTAVPEPASAVLLALGLAALASRRSGILISR